MYPALPSLRFNIKSKGILFKFVSLDMRSAFPALKRNSLMSRKGTSFLKSLKRDMML